MDKLPKYCELHIVLAPDRYQIIQLDKPALANSEIGRFRGNPRQIYWHELF